jgi:hypothetical protein
MMNRTKNRRKKAQKAQKGSGLFVPFAPFCGNSSLLNYGD